MAVTDKELKMDKELKNFAKYDGKTLQNMMTLRRHSPSYGNSSNGLR
jgi:hypothetical protein